MGREIRQVPPNWEHPKDVNGHHTPLHSGSYRDAKKEWIAGLLEWEAGTHEDFDKWGDKHNYWEWRGMPPEKDLYGDFAPEDATWFQIYETVSEGTPVSPPFETREELAQWLAAAGDYWCQARPHEAPPTLEQARAFVEEAWAPSMIISDGKISGPYDPPE